MTKPILIPRAVRGWVLPLALLSVWWIACRLGWSQSPLLVAPQQVWDSAMQLSQSGVLWQALSASLTRNLIGFAIGSVAGLLLGTALGLSRLLENLIGPTFHTLKQISLFAWIPLISLWFGLGEGAKIAFLALAAFFPVVLNTFEGIRNVPRELLEVARVLGFSRWQLLSKVIFPAAAASIFTGIYLGLIYAWLGTLGAEYLLSAGWGIGNLLTDGREHFQMDQVILGVIVVGLVGFGLNWIASLAEQRLPGWRGASNGRI